MSDDSAMPEDDPRTMGTGDQQPEEQPGGGDGREQGPQSATDNPDAPDTSADEEGDAGQATGNPGAAGG
ncbi:MAG: hypothetical protein ACXVFN_04330 [Solirubrobacteraceae bacterium]